MDDNKKVFLKHLGRRIRLCRENMSMSQETLAKMLGYKSKSSINKMESGINDIPQSTLKRIAEILHTTPTFLIDGDAPDELVADKLQEKIARPTPGHRRSMPIDDRQRSEQPHNVHAVVASIEDRAQCVIVHYVSAKKSDYPGKPQQA